MDGKDDDFLRSFRKRTIIASFVRNCFYSFTNIVNCCKLRSVLGPTLLGVNRGPESVSDFLQAL